MARIVKKSTQLEDTYQKERTKVIVFGSITAVCFILFTSPVAEALPLGRIIVALGFAVAGYFLGVAWSKFSAARAGVKGQKAVEDMVRKLPDTYVGYQNLSITHKGKTIHTQMVVVGPNGVFVIQSNHRNGRVEGHYNDTKWIQHKTGQKGGQYEKSFDSPVGRVKHQSGVLKEYLESNGVCAWIERMVWFTYPDVDLRVTGEPPRGTVGKVNVYTSLRDGAAESWQYIQSFAPTYPLSAEQVSRICALFDAL
jgi:hypothetical protein